MMLWRKNLPMKIPRKNWIKDANKGGGEEQSSFFVLYILYLNKKKQI